MKILSATSSIKPLLKRSAYFILLFVLVKSSSFFAPLLASNNAASLESYGAFEFALTFGVVASIVVDFGGNGAYPFFLFRKNDGSSPLIEFYFHYLPVLLVTLLLLLVNQMLHVFSLKYELAIVVTTILGMQTRISTISKSKENIYGSALADGGLFLIVNLYNVYLYAAAQPFELREVYFIFLCYAGLLGMIYMAHFYRYRNTFSSEKYRSILKWGSRIIISTFLVIALTGSARLLIEALIGTEAVGRYGFYFRLASFMVLLHQAVNIFLFKKIYITEAAILNNYLSYFLGGIFLLSLIVWQVAPVVFAPFFKVLNSYNAEDQVLFLLLCAHVFYWISMAIYENIIYREDISGLMNRYFLLIFAAFTGCCIVAQQMNTLTINTVCILNVCALFFCTEAQYICLRKKNIHFSKLRWVNIIGFLIFTAVYAGLLI